MILVWKEFHRNNGFRINSNVSFHNNPEKKKTLIDASKLMSIDMWKIIYSDPVNGAQLCFCIDQFILFFSFLNNWLNGFDDCFWILNSMWWRLQWWLWCCYAYRQCIINREEAANLYNGWYQCTVCESWCDALFAYKLLMCEWWTVPNPNRMNFSTNHDNRASQSILARKARNPNHPSVLIGQTTSDYWLAPWCCEHISLTRKWNKFQCTLQPVHSVGCVWMRRGNSIGCAHSKQHLRMLSTWGTRRRWFLWWKSVHSIENKQWI